MKRMRPPIRLRLTLTYTVFFVVAGTILVGLNLSLLAQGTYYPTGPQMDAMEAAISQAYTDTTPPARQKAVVSGAIIGLQKELRQAAQGRMVEQSAVALGVMALVSVGLGWLSAGRALRPVIDITRIARRASEQEFDQRVRLSGPDDELKKLGDTIDHMLDRLDIAFASQRRFVADASHELRTPLAIMRTATDVALAGPQPSAIQLTEMARAVRDSVNRAEALTTSLLVLARSSGPLRETDYLDLTDTVQDALEAAAPACLERSLTAHTDLKDAPIWGDRPLLESLVGNLIENAVRHNVGGGWIDVATRVEDGCAVLRVANSGSPIPPSAVPELFEPFRRGNGSRVSSGRGSGLGLSIVRAVASAHSGGVDARPVPGGGLEVTVRLPAAVGVSTLPRPRPEAR
jgi:signal transduction histidine kinase